MAIAIAPVLRTLWPLTRWPAGSFFVGVVAGTIGYGFIGFSQDGWTPSLPWLALVCGTLVGGTLGLYWHYHPPGS